MPTYDYVCDACDHEFELYQSIIADPEKKCPECGKRKLRRLIGPGAAIVFKGSGFYSTDYRSDLYKRSRRRRQARGHSTGSKDTSSSTGKARRARARRRIEMADDGRGIRSRLRNIFSI